MLKAYQNIPNKLWLLIAVLFLNRMGSTLLVFISVYLSTVKHFDLPTVGGIVAMYGIGSALGSLLGGFLSQRLGARFTQCFSLFLLAATVLCIEIATLPSHFYVILFFAGLFSQSLKPANTMSIICLSTDDTRMRNLSLERQAANLGMAIAPVLAGALAGHGMIWAFRLNVFFSALAGFAILLFLEKDSPPPKLNDDLGEKFDLRGFFNLDLLTMVFVTTTMGTIFFQVFTSVPLLVTNFLNRPSSDLGMILTLNGILILLIEVPLVNRIRHQNPRIMLPIGMFLLAASFVWMQFSSGLFMLMVGMLIFTLGEMIGIPFLLQFALGGVDQRNRAMQIGVFGAVNSFSLTIASLLGGKVISRWGYSTLWAMLLFSAFLVAIVLWSGMSPECSPLRIARSFLRKEKLNA